MITGIADESDKSDSMFSMPFDRGTRGGIRNRCYSLTVCAVLLLSFVVPSAFGMGLGGGGGSPATSPSPTASFLYAVPTTGYSPARIAVSPQGIYVTAPLNSSVLLYARDGRQTASIAGFSEPLAIAVDRTGNTIYIGDSREGRVTAIDPAGVPLFHLGQGRGEFGIPGDIAVAPDGTLFITDSPNDRVRVYAADGSPRFSFGSTGFGPGEMKFPTGIAIDEAQGEVYVVDQGNARVQVFDLAGAALRSFSEFGSSGGRLSQPQGIWIRSDRVYIADSFQGRVQVFDRAGTFIEVLGQFGDAPGHLMTPKDVASDGGTLFVSNTGNQRIEAYQVGPHTGLTVDPAIISFTRGTSLTPPAQIVQLSPQSAGASVPWSASASAPFAVLLSQTTGTAPTAITVSVDPGALAPGSYGGSIVFRANGVDYPCAVNLTIIPRLNVTPASLSLLYQVSGELPVRSLAITSDATITWSAATASPLLSLSPASGATPGSISVAANQNVRPLAEGSYSAAVTVASPSAAGSPATVPVTITVKVAGTIKVNSTTDLSAFTISGPATFAGAGRTWRNDEAPPGRYTIRFGHVPGFRRPATRTVEVATGRTTMIDAVYRPLPVANVVIAAKGPGPENNAVVKLLDLNGAMIRQFKALPGDYGAQVAAGDVDGDGYAEIIAAPGPSPRNEAQFTVFRADGTVLASIRAIPDTAYGAHVAVGDILGQGRSEIALSFTSSERDQHGIILYSLDDRNRPVERSRFMVPFVREKDDDDDYESCDDKNGNYPAQVAFGDVNGDGMLELTVVLGRAIEIYAFDANLRARRIASGSLRSDTRAGSAYRSLPTVASADIDGDGLDEIIIGFKKDRDAWFRVLRGDLTPAAAAVKVFENARSAPVLSAMDMTGDGVAEVLAGPGAHPGSGGTLRIMSGTGDPLREFTAFKDVRFGVVVAFGSIMR